MLSRPIRPNSSVTALQETQRVCTDRLMLYRKSSPTHLQIALAFAVLLINSRIDNETWARTADQEIEYLYNEVPQTEDGGISHRQERVQLWADFVYMVNILRALGCTVY